MKRLSYLLLVLLLFSCGKNKDFYSIDPQFQPYLDAFLKEGKERGHIFDVEKTGLIMKFGHLSGSQIGLCHHQVPLLIEIDSAYWQSVSGKKNEKELKADLIFHELGHGLLLRSHDNSVLPSGDWKSIMCGGEKVDSRNWNVNFYGFREKYYLDELFNPKTPVPDWALTQPDFSNLKYKTAFFDDFFNNNNKWVVGNTPLYKSFVSGNEYKFQTKTEKAMMPVTDLGIDVSGDFLFEAKIRMAKNNNSSAKFGIVFGMRDDSDTNYFLIDGKKEFYVGNSQYFGWFTECISEYIKPLLPNTISVRKVNDMFYFYIDGKFVYQNEAVEPKGSFFGIRLSGNSTVFVDYVKISLPVEEEIPNIIEHLVLEDSIVSEKKDRQSVTPLDTVINTSPKIKNDSISHKTHVK